MSFTALYGFDADKGRSSSPFVFSSRRLWPFSDSASALSQLPWCLRRWWVFPKSDQGFCTKPASVHGTREVWYWNDSCHKVIKVGKDALSKDETSLESSAHDIQTYETAVWDMKSARKWLVWFLCRQGKDVLSLGVRNGWKEFGIFGRRLLCNVSLGHENRHWTGEDFSLLSTSFRGQRCLWRNSHAPTMHCTFKNLVQMQLCQVKLCHEIFWDVHNTSKILNKGTVALDQKTAWLLLSRLDRWL